MTAILMIFDYHQNHDDYLEGARFDLQYITEWLLLLDLKIYILTDIIDYQHDHRTIVYQVHSTDDLITCLYDITKVISKRLFFYYSGHSYPTNEFLLPNLKHQSFNIIKDVILKYEDVLMMMDCCYSNSILFLLPFKWVTNRFKINNYNQIDDYDNQIILITSSSDQERSASTKYGSVFTRCFINYLHLYKNKKLLNLINMIDSINQMMTTQINQTISVYASHHIYPLLPVWIYPHHLNVIYHPYYPILLIQ
ncbi:MAG TPA: caspase family protein [Candidatus Saccharimonadales bacterium]|nr:caspase family protein [Candidatus Saccharimonadales bacterium]